MDEDTEAAAIVLRQSAETQLEGDKKLSVELNQIIITAEAIHHSYLKFTGDKVIVLLASNTMVPLTAGSFLLTLEISNQEMRYFSSQVLGFT